MDRSISILIFLLLGCAFGQIDEDKKNTTWDYLIFAQIWPYSICEVANLLKPETCLVPQKVTGGWTVHGLWPTRDGQMGPENCVPADHFDLEKIKPLIGEMLHHWPNLIPQDPIFSLWQHEWTKHGTCAEQLELIDGESKYFSAGLRLNEEFSIKNMLSASDIEPSEDAKFKASDISAAIEKAKNKKPQVHCLKAVESGKTKWFLVDVRLCFDKQLNIRDCPQPKPGHQLDKSELIELMAIPNVEQCPKDVLLYYIPPKPDHYHTEHYQNAHGYAYERNDEL